MEGRLRKSKPVRHSAGARNRRKALHFAENLREELEHLDRDLHRLLKEHVRYALGRIYRLESRLRAEKSRDG
jgi:hypothetical protein